MRKQFKRNICFLITMLLVATMLSACSSAKTEEAPKQEVQQAEVVKQEVQQEEIKEEVVKEPEPEPEPKPEPEPELEITGYEGIDMESTLPGVEWINTFEGIIEEPKFVVFNDETNKKVIVEDKVTLDSGDIFAVYTPNGELVKKANGIKLKETEGKGYYITISFDEEYFTKTKDFEVETDDGKQVKCTITPNFK